MQRLIYTIGITALMMGCSLMNKFPSENYYQFSYYRNYYQQNDSLIFEIQNPLKCPLRVSISSKDKELKQLVNLFDTITLKENSDTLLKFYFPFEKDLEINFRSVFGSLNKEIKKVTIAFPFCEGKTHKILQGYNGRYSHSTNYSRYALDFDLKVNDTICSADEGFVVGVIEDYKYGGSSKKWKNNDKSNFITIYHPHSGLFTQYVHLIHKGSFVKIGDKVRRGQAIGLSGTTGFTSVEHLHFNVLKPSYSGGLVSTEIEFCGGSLGKNLKYKDTVKNVQKESTITK
ncbi:M23 family metallopeptidase [Marinifilum flexuosum]|uniref:M23 family metallopeptidase n=1 Tax=Marinifilum flexuosum TaxID=1117708 RepID=UPI0024944862|nr:M23 family metallopeptidase [Marinifilum flexuosum]